MSEQKLNCWPGCLAIIKSIPDTVEAGIAGKIVTTLHIETPNDTKKIELFGLYWRISPELPDRSGKYKSIVRIADCALRPIIPPPGTDITETDVTNDTHINEPVTS